MSSSRAIYVSFMLLALAASLGLASAFAADEPAYTAATTQDANVPVDELTWLVKPLTKEQLVVEADAWRDLLQQKVAQISAAEIAVKQKNKEITAAQDKADAAAEATVAAKTPDAAPAAAPNAPDAAAPAAAPAARGRAWRPFRARRRSRSPGSARPAYAGLPHRLQWQRRANDRK